MHTSNQRVQRNALCPCGSGKKFKHCCIHNSFMGDVHRARPIPGDGASLRASSPPPMPITRVAVSYVIDDQFGKAEVSFCYPIGTFIIMANGTIQPVETLQPGMLFRLEDGGVATVTQIESPEVWEPPSEEKDANGNSVRRVIGKVKYTGYYPRIDLFVRGDVLKTTPGHLFWSVTRSGWHPAESFQQGEMLRSKEGLPVPVESLSQIFYEFGTLHNLEVEEHHTYFVGGGSHGGILTHNGMEMGCRVPRAAVAEAIENGELRVVGRKGAGIRTPNELNPQHHIFPQEEAPWFRQRGILVDEYSIRVPLNHHEMIHAGGGPGRGGGWYNTRVMEVLRDREKALGRQLTGWEIEEYVGTFIDRFDLGNGFVLPYIR